MSGVALRQVAEQLELAKADPSRGDGLGQLIQCAEGEDGSRKAPEWIPILPDAKLIEARDGRKFANPGPQTLIDAFAANQADLYLDWDHEGVSWFGGRSPAAGWIVELKAEGSHGLKGRVEWTDKGRGSVEAREWRYISPAMRIQWPDPDDDDDPNGDGFPTITRIVNVALVNLPALRMPALTSEQPNNPAKKAGSSMNKAILAALGLPDTASEADAVAAIAKLAEPQTPDLTAYVPKADHESVSTKLAETQAKLAALKTKLDEQASASRDAEINAALDEAQNSGRMAPASRPLWEKFCRDSEDGLATFKAHMAAAAPVIDPVRPSPTNNPAPASATLSAEDRELCRKNRIPIEKFQAARERELVRAQEG